MGGGSLLMLWLTIVLGMEQEQARLMNLMFFIPCALSATLFRWKEGKLSMALTLAAIAGGCAGAFLGSAWRQHLDLEWMRKIFGGFFILCGLRELLYRPRKAR